MKASLLMGWMVATAFSTSALAADTGFDQVLALAKGNEASLTGSAEDALKQGENHANLTAMSACVPSRTLTESETHFLIVAQLNQAGAVEKTWRRGESDFAKCYEARLEGMVIYQPVTAPFYVYFNVR